MCLFHALEEWSGLAHMEDYLSVVEYLLWVFTPLAIVFILPFLIVIFLYLSILFLHVYKVRQLSTVATLEWRVIFEVTEVTEVRRQHQVQTTVVLL